MNLPNKITLSRVFAVPVFMFFTLPIPEWVVNSRYLAFFSHEMNSINHFILNYGHFFAAGIFIIAASTDGVDGYIARKRKMVTTLGKFLDPIADKLLVTAALIALVQRGNVTGWAAMIIVAREFIVTGFRLIAAGEGVVIEASLLGKIKTITQMVAIVVALTSNFPFTHFTDIELDRWLMMLAVIVTLYSGFDYIMKNIKLIDSK